MAHEVAAELGLQSCAPDAGASGWEEPLRRLVGWTREFEGERPARTVHRLKQWLGYAARFGGFAGFDSVKRAESAEELFACLRAAGGTELSGRTGRVLR